MKKLITVLGLVAMTATVFAQGKIGLQNPATAPVTLSSVPGTFLAADAALAGLPVGNSVPLLSGKTLAIGLYAGTTSGNLSYYLPNSGANALLNNAIGTAGLVSLQQIQFMNPLVMANVSVFGKIKVWDSAYATYELTPDSAYKGETAQFTFMTKSTYASVAASVPAGPIFVGVVPEPTSAAIAGLGLASMLVFRRRK